MNNVPSQVADSVIRHVKADLEPGATTIFVKSGIAVTLGGLLSLFLCGQFGISLGSKAFHIEHWLMGSMGVVGCTITCGVLFAVLPAFMLKLLCSPMQFRVMTRKKWHASFIWIVLFGLSLILWNSSSNPYWEIILWSAAAIASFVILAWLLDRISAIFRGLALIAFKI